MRTPAASAFSAGDYLLRVAAAAVLVGVSYNPEAYSYYHWAIVNLPDVSAEKAVAGIALLIGWMIFLRATFSALGVIGLVLAASLFGSLVWLLMSWGWISTDSPKVLIYAAEVVTALVLATGLSWSFIRRRLSGQLDVDDVED